MSDIVLAAINAKWIHPSLALRLLKANLGEYESRCEIVEFAPRQSLEEKLGILAGFRPKILGLSVSIWNHKASLELLGALREPGKNNPSRGLPTEEPGGPGPPVVVLGGPEVSCLPEESEIIRYADFVIRGEGEEAFAELCGRLLNGEKPRSRFIDGRAADLAVLNPAYRLYSDEDLRRKLVYVEASRDCPFACAFCQSAI
ncbi:MAG: cobalamin-dependent protein, partial [Treponema sp.]|nr:cobalamin-dependent protein [Treponema sp.]